MQQNKWRALSSTPLLTELNRVERLYRGGSLLDRWQGLPPRPDSTCSEEFLVSTVEYIGPGDPPARGISRVGTPDGEPVPLTRILESDPPAFLGTRYAERLGARSGVLVRVGDSTVRLVLQTHPTAAMAGEHFGLDFGKTEAWYIADTREIDGEQPYLYCGLKLGVTRAHWARLFGEQDVAGMLGCMHRLPIQRGDTVLIPAGMPHAMGPGAVFIEIHEPCDYTIRFEKHYAVRPLADEEMHYGLGFETMLDLVDYTTYDEEAVRRACVMQPTLLEQREGGRLAELIGARDTPAFRLHKLELEGSFPIPAFDGHFLLITAEGPVRLEYAGGVREIPQGRGVFVPAGVRDLAAQGGGVLLLAYPFE